MRQNPNSRRSRGRGNRKPGNSRNQIFDSNGPGARVRGNSAQIYEKYQQLARDATSSSDRVAAENYYQHGEHYFRMMEAAGLNRNANAQDESQQRNGNAAQGGTTVEAAAAASEPTSEPSPEGAAEPTQAAEIAASGQPEQASPEATNGSGDSEGDATPARRTKARRPNGPPNGRNAPDNDADAATSEDDSDKQTEDPNPVSA